MQLKRFALFRDDVRDLVTLTVDRALHALTAGLGRIQWPGVIFHDINFTTVTSVVTASYGCPKLQPCPCATSSMRSQSVAQHSVTKET